jgi:hypothetical protein
MSLPLVVLVGQAADSPARRSAGWRGARPRRPAPPRRPTRPRSRSAGSTPAAARPRRVHRHGHHHGRRAVRPTTSDPTFQHELHAPGAARPSPPCVIGGPDRPGGGGGGRRSSLGQRGGNRIIHRRIGRGFRLGRGLRFLRRLRRRPLGRGFRGGHLFGARRPRPRADRGGGRAVILGAVRLGQQFGARLGRGGLGAGFLDDRRLGRQARR